VVVRCFCRAEYRSFQKLPQHPKWVYLLNLVAEAGSVKVNNEPIPVDFWHVVEMNPCLVVDLSDNRPGKGAYAIQGYPDWLTPFQILRAAEKHA
jgi:hypothetical protein